MNCNLGLRRVTGATSGYWDYIGLLGLHRVTGTTSGYWDYIGLLELHRVTGTTSGYWNYIGLLELHRVTGTTSGYWNYITGTTSGYWIVRKWFYSGVATFESSNSIEGWEQISFNLYISFKKSFTCPSNTE